jgi:hypothetical protein
LLPFIIIIAINIFGYLLKSFGLDRHIIILGFRFHLATTLPLVILFNKKAFEFIITQIKQFSFRKGFYTIFALFLCAAVFPAAMYLKGLCSFTDPDYLYELGVSSVIDYPVYLLWNLPQLLIFSGFLFYVSGGKKSGFLLVFLVAVFSFAYEFLPVYGSPVVYNDIYLLLLAALLFAVCISGLNIYLSSLVMFTVFWGNILIFGNYSGVILKLLLARNYTRWDGILAPDKSFGNYVILIQFGIAVILFLPTLLLNSNKQKIVISNFPHSEAQIKSRIE